MPRKIKAILIFLLSFTAMMHADNKRFVLVVDAGHGGRDVGALGAISKEKDLTLKMALAFGKMVERKCPDVKVVYTRKTDKFLELWQRAEIANKNKADLFLSIHINSLPNGRIATGYQTYTLGKGKSGIGIQKNLEVAKRENAVILLEKNYQQIYQGFDPNSPESNIMFEFMQDKNMEQSVHLAKFMQKHVCASTGRKDMGAHQDNLAVLRLSSMPGCLLELGFISTPEEEKFMNSPEAPNLYATGIFNAFMEYRNKYDRRIVPPYQPTTEPRINVPEIVPEVYKNKEKEPTENNKNKQSEDKEGNVTPIQPLATLPDAEEKPVFKVQILASSRRLQVGDEHLKGVKEFDTYEENNLIKYTCGASADYHEINRLKRELAEKFPQAFVIAFKNGQRMNVQEAIKEFMSNPNKP